MKKPEFARNEIYHIYNRGVEKRDVFLDDKDRFRFIHDLFEFNDSEPVLNMHYHLNHKQRQSIEVEPQYVKPKHKRKLLVEILAFCFMPNHYHLIVRQKVGNGIVAFMQKLGTGYTMYFNNKYERVGPLFQGRFKAVLVQKDRHYMYLPHYIHLNPLDLIMPSWREKEIKNHKKAIEFLENYRWSSFPDYIGKKNFPSVTQRNILLDFFDGPSGYKQSIKKYLKDIELEPVRHLLLE